MTVPDARFGGQGAAPRGSGPERRQVELLGIGAGPGNLALAIALEEMAPADLAADSLIIEQHDDVAWQRGMLLPWAQSQVSFLKDLVTRRNPRSKFSFVNYLHSVGRLDDFINLGAFTPYRTEFSNYVRWVADSLESVRIEHGRQCVSIEPAASDDGVVTEWVVELADGSEIACRNLVIGAGRDPFVPAQFAPVPRERLIHSTEFTGRVGELDRDAPLRIVVVGGAQSAAEMLMESHRLFPRATCTMVMRSIGLNNYESSKFTNELFYPSFVDSFYDALPESRGQLLREMHRTNYSGLAPATLDSLYREVYLEKLSGERRLRMITMAEVTEAHLEDDGDIRLSILDRRTGTFTDHRCDVVMLGTGFTKTMPRVIRELAGRLGLEEVSVTRNYRMDLPPTVTASCYLQGVNEATHGIADSLLSVLASRAEDILADLLARRQPRELAAARPTERWRTA